MSEDNSAHGEAMLQSDLADEGQLPSESDAPADPLPTDIAVGAMLRDLDLEAGLDSLDVRHGGNGLATASEDDFAVVGVRNMEWRLPVIRVAAHRSAEAIASSQLVAPSVEKEEYLAQIVLSTYRLIDPRHRGSYFQQIRVGRLMPLLLQRTAGIDFMPPPPYGHQPSTAPDTVSLFGHPIPKQPTPGSSPQPSPSRPSFHPRILGRRRVRRMTADSSSDRAEALEVLAELRARSMSAVWARWLQDTRFRAVLAGMAAILIIGIGVFSRRGRTDAPPSIAEQLSNAPLANSSNALLAPTIVAIDPLGNDAAEIPPNPPVTPSLPVSPEPPLPVNTTPTPNPSPSPNPSPAPNPSPTPDLVPAPALSLPQDDLMTVMPDSFEMSNSIIPLMEPPQVEMPMIWPLDLDLGPAAPPVAQPEPDWGEMKPQGESLDPAKVAEAASQLWTETQSAARRFTASDAAELIDEWDLIAELSGKGTIEHAAAKQLILEAAWLNHPLAEIVAMMRKSLEGGSLLPAHGPGAENPLRDTTNLSVGEVDRLFASWKAARKRVVHAVDLNQMLLQSNRLIDCVLISDSLAPQKRVDRITTLKDEIQRLANISSDKELIAQSNELLASIHSLPDATAWTRLEAAEKPSGLLATIYCLQQRRWQTGLQWLGQSSNLPVAAAAKTEWELIRSDGDSEPTGPQQRERESDWIALAARWGKIADRLEGREAAAVRLHAIELYGDSPAHENERKSLRERLPRYLR